MKAKDYNLIASAFKWDINFLNGGVAKKPDGYWQHELQALKAVAVHLATKLGVNDPKFNKDKFLQACGIEEKPSLVSRMLDAPFKD